MEEHYARENHRTTLSPVSYTHLDVYKRQDENAVIAAVTAAGYDPYEHKILGVTAMTSLLGKKQFNDILGGLITKPQGKPTLVPDSDKRPAMTTIIDDFKEDN